MYLSNPILFILWHKSIFYFICKMLLVGIQFYILVFLNANVCFTVDAYDSLTFHNYITCLWNICETVTYGQTWKALDVNVIVLTKKKKKIDKINFDLSGGIVISEPVLRYGIVGSIPVLNLDVIFVYVLRINAFIINMYVCIRQCMWKIFIYKLHLIFCTLI